MTSDKDAMEKAARDIASWCWCSGTTCSGCEVNTQKIFKSGWMSAHDGPKVMALVEALKYLRNESILYDDHSAYEMADKALAYFEGEM